VIVRQERIGLHMADAISRVTSGRMLGAFCMQHGPGAENAYGGVAQCYGESIPVLVVPQGYPRRIAGVDPNFSSALQMRGVTKSAEHLMLPKEAPNALRRAFSRLRNGRGGPCLVEVPTDLWNEEIGDFTYTPVATARTAPDPADVLRQLAELLGAPVTTSLGGKSSFPENHPLSLGSGGNSVPLAVHRFVQNADLVIGIGCSFTETNFGIKFPDGKKIVHATLEPDHLNKDVRAEAALLGDARLVLEALIGELGQTLKAPRDASAVIAEIAKLREEFLAQWMPLLTSNDTPLSPYRVIWDLMHTVERDNCIITHDAGSPRDQISPFWVSTTPLSYIGWGKTTQLGYGLGLAMGAKLAKPDKLCINLWGDAAIGFTGMDFETAVRERIPILSILLNNFSMAIELKVMPVSTEKYRSTDISGHYADMAKAFGGYGERVTQPGEIRAAVQRGIKATQDGRPALLEFITSKETRVSKL
jgi:acetolactate synthase-1/2/3 large subunit